MPRAAALASALLFSLSTPALAQEKCGGEFGQWLAGVKAEAAAAGAPAKGIEALSRALYDKKVIGRDRQQSVFAQTFADFSSRMVSDYRLKQGAKHMKDYAQTFARAEADHGVPAAVITAFWALETDFGAVQGDFDTLNALATLAYDCRRPELFRPQLIALAKLIGHGDVPERVQGAWAGEIGQVQILPADIIKHGSDGNGDGLVDLRGTKEDVIMTAAKFLQDLGWRRGEPWLQEVTIPSDLPWEETGRTNRLPVKQWEEWGVKARNGALREDLSAGLVLPMGKDGPAFLAYQNFDVYLEWNKSIVYTLTAAYLATRFDGAPKVDLRTPSPGLQIIEMKELQTKLRARGHDVGEIDGILGLGTREAVRAEQKRLGLPVDGWPTRALMDAL
ncbi:MAG: lytic murein transglycosylase [Notoacmeibacter sp.]|nr:lytic murein transglycosylase [Notoacmeibacter sp.]